MPINARTLFGFLGSFPRNLKQLNPSDAVLKAVVGVDAGHSRSRRSFDVHVSRRGGRLCPPAGYIGFTDIFGETAASQRADVGIGPYMTPANSCCPANFECKAFLQQILNRSYSQIWCTITGGAYQIARRVSTCVRNICKSDSCLNCTRRTHQTRPSAPFLPILFRQDGKEWAVGDIPQYHIPIKVPNQTGELP